eukprot:1091113-Amphidinium_carterae.1
MAAGKEATLRKGRNMGQSCCQTRIENIRKQVLPLGLFWLKGVLQEQKMDGSGVAGMQNQSEAPGAAIGRPPVELEDAET